MPKKEEVDKLIGKEANVTFKDGDIKKGTLLFVSEFSSRYGYKKPNLYYINNIGFRVSHIKKISKA